MARHGEPRRGAAHLRDDPLVGALELLAVLVQPTVRVALREQRVVECGDLRLKACTLLAAGTSVPDAHVRFTLP